MEEYDASRIKEDATMSGEAMHVAITEVVIEEPVENHCVIENMQSDSECTVAMVIPSEASETPSNHELLMTVPVEYSHLAEEQFTANVELKSDSDHGIKSKAVEILSTDYTEEVIEVETVLDKCNTEHVDVDPSQSVVGIEEAKYKDKAPVSQDVFDEQPPFVSNIEIVEMKLEDDIPMELGHSTESSEFAVTEQGKNEENHQMDVKELKNGDNEATEAVNKVILLEKNTMEEDNVEKVEHTILASSVFGRETAPLGEIETSTKGDLHGPFIVNKVNIVLASCDGEKETFVSEKFIDGPTERMSELDIDYKGSTDSNKVDVPTSIVFHQESPSNVVNSDLASMPKLDALSESSAKPCKGKEAMQSQGEPSPGNGEAGDPENLPEAATPGIPEKVDPGANTLEGVRNDQRRSVIQDIFDDWRDENPEEEGQVASKSQDSVEIQLKSLLDEDSVSQKTKELRSADPEESTQTKGNQEATPGKDPEGETGNSSRKVEPSGKEPASRSTTNLGRHPKSLSNEVDPKKRTPAPKPFPGQVTQEVTAALKERFREKQKNLEVPQVPDIFFVKKITQRLSSKLSSSTSSLPSLIPLTKGPRPGDDVEASTGSVDNKELLAILEGDVDPDWSNLKSPAPEERKSPKSQDDQAKLDPATERELALKQLLQLPSCTFRKGSPKKKKKPSKSEEPEKLVEKVVESSEKRNSEEVDKQVAQVDEVAQEEEEDLEAKTRKDEEEPKTYISRSSRKRRLTEKALEQFAVKRQKVVHRSPTHKSAEVGKKATQEQSSSPARVEVASTGKASLQDVEDSSTSSKKSTGKQEVPAKEDSANGKRPKPSSSKKQSPPKKKPPPKKPPESTKISKKSSKSSSKSPKRSSEGTEAKPPKKRLPINEIDRLLQDEGVVNLLYEVEQPDKKRLVPVAKTQAKVMDMQKVQRELKIRTKLVRNAVLRLRTSGSGPSKATPRSKRSTSSFSLESPGKREDFVVPARIRNAAEASVIVRRHSSSSFSSASGSPRVSVESKDPLRQAKDYQEKMAEAQSTEATGHSLRSLQASKKRAVQDEVARQASSKKKKPRPHGNEDAAEAPPPVAMATRSNRKPAARAGERPRDDVIELSSSSEDEAEDKSKIVTRSNGAARKTAKKATRSKVTFAKEEDEVEDKDDKDELSACLAEAATALSDVSAGGRATVNHKNKGSVNINEVQEAEEVQVKSGAESQFSNKEVNVRRHGNLVQLILTPSTSSKLRNGITVQVMKELCDTLSILRNDDACRIVLLTSTGSSFCEGLELSGLLQANKEERRIRAQDMANSVKEFIKNLAAFNKPIVAGVQGAAVGLGVTILPLFDLVIASDKATFSTPYGKLGQIAEGAAIFTLSHILGNAVASELLLGGRTLTANEALRAGLVTRVLWPDRFQLELLPSLRSMSDQSSQSMEATKALLRQNLRKKLDAALESESYILVQHWCSTECQAAIKAYIEERI
ncbi:titin [Orussus abietinus]|uniref:titin n=1 Tax=Orussus abietinus TaxID=222816 RepID=UPI000625FFB8|nr:titin [Orussus abietinus]XP_012273482.1 titin [Orussus abietinus]